MHYINYSSDFRCCAVATTRRSKWDVYADYFTAKKENGKIMSFSAKGKTFFHGNDKVF